MIQMKSGAQAGLEYLLTYGWAIVLIAAVLGVLVFIVGSPASGISFSSSDSTKILVKAGAVSGTNAEIRLQNITGGDIEITGVVGQGYSGCTVNEGGTPLQVGAGGQINLECTAPSDGAGTISIEYTDYAGLPRSVAITASGGTAETNTTIMLNSSNNQTCEQVCQGGGHSGCLSVGLDAGASDGMSKHWKSFPTSSCEELGGITCASIMGNYPLMCAGHYLDWTNCLCFD